MSKIIIIVIAYLCRPVISSPAEVDLVCEAVQKTHQSFNKMSAWICYQWQSLFQFHLLVSIQNIP